MSRRIVRPGEPLSRWERWGLAALFGALVVFGGIVELRSAFLWHQAKQRTEQRTDLGVYLRAAWAVRGGADLYAVTDDRTLHYNCPPLLAILLVPLAYPPAYASRAGTVPFAGSVALWYAFSLLCLAVAVNCLAGGIEQTSSDPAVREQRRGCRRWWGLRVIPVLICLPAIGNTLSAGQVNLLVLALMCGMIAAALRGRSGQAGFWLAAAIAAKVIPAFLVLYPLWRRDVRWLANCLLGLVLGLGVIPAAVFGPARALAYYREWTGVVLQPSLAGRGDRSRARELVGMTTRSQSLQAVWHNTLHWNRPMRLSAQPALGIRRAHWLVGGLLTVLTLGAAGWRRSDRGLTVVLVAGALMVLMLVLSPVCHLHYFCLSLPLVMGLVAVGWEREAADRWRPGTVLLWVAYVVANVLPLLPELRVCRDLGLAMYAGLVLWLVGVVVLWNRAHGPWGGSRRLRGSAGLDHPRSAAAPSRV